MATKIVLNTQQESAIADMLKFLKSDEADMFTLKGFAGTGKTTTIQFLLDRMTENGLTERFVFTAPTHKAVKVLRRMAERAGIEVAFSTIHSLLGLKIKLVGDKQLLEPQKRRNKDPMNSVDIIVVDECSMIGSELFKHIQDSLKKYDVKYIFMGDPAQLPPVGEKESQTFEATPCRASLTQVMRQRGENPVLGVCTDIREAFLRGDMRLPKITPGMADDGSIGVSVMVGDLFSEWMPIAFSHEKFNDNPDRFRVVAWRNDTVNRINAMIHDWRYPECATWLATGEPITFVKPMMNMSLLNQRSDVPGDEILVQTDFEAEIIDCQPTVRKEFPDVPCWLVTVAVETGERLTFYALDNDGIVTRNAVMQLIAAENKRVIKAGDKKADWWPYYQLQQSFAEIRPAYCMTAHKSQGSTFENVFVDVMDIWANPNKHEAMQCLYVACSRASHHLIVNATGAQ